MWSVKEGVLMTDITLHTKSKSTVTCVSNTFIDEYMADANGEFVKIWDSVSSIAQFYGIKTTAPISRVCRHMKGRLTYKGYRWEYGQ